MKNNLSYWQQAKQELREEQAYKLIAILSDLLIPLSLTIIIVICVYKALIN